MVLLKDSRIGGVYRKSNKVSQIVSQIKIKGIKLPSMIKNQEQNKR